MADLKGKLVIVVEDVGMDSGCLMAILTECSYHGRVLAAHMGGVNEAGERYHTDLADMLTDLEQGQIPGKC